jgi:hypothetical protein
MASSVARELFDRYEITQPADIECPSLLLRLQQSAITKHSSTRMAGLPHFKSTLYDSGEMRLVGAGQRDLDRSV